MALRKVQQIVNYCRLHDIGYMGLKFMWKRGRVQEMIN